MAEREGIRQTDETKADLYKQAGYHFAAFTEHNVFAADTNRWRAVAISGGLSQTRFDDYVAAFSTKRLFGLRSLCL